MQPSNCGTGQQIGWRAFSERSSSCSCCALPKTTNLHGSVLPCVGAQFAASSSCSIMHLHAHFFMAAHAVCFHSSLGLHADITRGQLC